MITIRNTKGRFLRDYKKETKMLAIQKALFYCDYDFRKSYKDGVVFIKQADVHDFVIYLDSFMKELNNSNKN